MQGFPRPEQEAASLDLLRRLLITVPPGARDRLFVDTTDGHVKVIHPDGTIVDLEALGFALPAGLDALLLTHDDSQPSDIRWGPLVTTPAQFGADQNDWAPGRKNVYRASSDASRNLTGLVAGTDGEVRRIVNVGAFNIVLKHDQSSSGPNRFITPNAVDLALEPGDMAEVLYDLTTSRWRAYRLEGGIIIVGADPGWVEFWWPPNFSQAPG